MAYSQQQSEIFTQILQKLGLSVQSQRSSRSHQHLYFVTPVGIIVVASHQFGVDLPVGNIAQALENDDNGTQKFLLFV